MQNFENFLDELPEQARDIKLNIKNLMASEAPLNKKQTLITALACAYAVKNHEVQNVFLGLATEGGLSETELNAAKTAAIIMGMTNIYYRFTHLVSNQEYGSMPVGLRMNGLAGHGIEKTDFELASLAVSAINGCGQCMSAHENILNAKHGVSKEAIQAAVKLAAVINALAFANNFK